MENLFSIPFGPIRISMLLNTMCRRSFQYKIGQECLSNPEGFMQYLKSHPGLIIYFGHVEYCKAKGEGPRHTEPEISQLIFKYGNDNESIEAMATMGKRYSELEETNPTVINNIF